MAASTLQSIFFWHGMNCSKLVVGFVFLISSFPYILTVPTPDPVYLPKGPSKVGLSWGYPPGGELELYLQCANRGEKLYKTCGFRCLFH